MIEPLKISKGIYRVSINKDITIGQEILSLEFQDLIELKRMNRKFKNKQHIILFPSNPNIPITLEVYNRIKEEGLLDFLDVRALREELTKIKVVSKYGSLLFDVDEYESTIGNIRKKEQEERRNYTPKTELKRLFKKYYKTTITKKSVYEQIANEKGISYKAVEKAILSK